MNLYKKNNLRSIFIVSTNPRKSKVIVGCICRYPTMDLNEFIHFYLNPLLKKLAIQQNIIFLLGHFNVDLIKYEQHKAANEFIDSLRYSMFFLYIFQPTWITPFSMTLIANSFSNYISQEIIPGNLTATILDCLPQVFIAPHFFSNVLNSKTNIFERNWSKVNQEKFILDYFTTD